MDPSVDVKRASSRNYRRGSSSPHSKVHLNSCATVPLLSSTTVASHNLSKSVLNNYPTLPLIANTATRRCSTPAGRCQSGVRSCPSSTDFSERDPMTQSLGDHLLLSPPSSSSSARSEEDGNSWNTKTIHMGALHLLNTRLGGVGGIRDRTRAMVELTGSQLLVHCGEPREPSDLAFSLDLSVIQGVEAADLTSFGRSHCFQILLEDQNLFLCAKSQEERDTWLAVIRIVCDHCVSWLLDYHPGIYIQGSWTCCKAVSSAAEGCTPTTGRNFTQNKPSVKALSQAVKLKMTSYSDSKENRKILSSRSPSSKPVRILGDIRNEPWYFKDLPQNVADTILRKQGPGSFMVRQLGTATKLSLVTMRAIKHLDVDRVVDSSGHKSFRIGRGSLFPSLQQLVEHYRQSPGLGITLDKHPVRRNVDEIWPFNLASLKVVSDYDLQLPWDVKFASWRSSNDVIVHQVRHVGNDDQQELFARHAKILMALNHENVCCLIGSSIENPRGPFIITESLSDGPLIDYLHRNTMSLLLRPNDLLGMASHVCRGMVYLENKGIVHNELVAENLVVNELCHVKIAGFHLSRYEGDYDSLVIPEYMYKVRVPPPEFYRNEFSCRSDVWTFGFLVWVIMKRGQDESFDIEQILHADWGTRLPPAIIERSRAIIRECLLEGPIQRPTFKELLPFLHQHSFPGPPYRFRNYSSEENTSASSGAEEEPHQAVSSSKTLKGDSQACLNRGAKRTKFPSTNNLAAVSSSEEQSDSSAPKRFSYPQTKSQEQKDPVVAAEASSSKPVPPPRTSSVSPSKFASEVAEKSNTVRSQPSLAPQLSIFKQEHNKNALSDSKPSETSNKTLAARNSAEIHAVPLASKKMQSIAPHIAAAVDKQVSELKVSLNPPVYSSLQTTDESLGREGFDRSTPKPGVSDCGQENIITGSSIGQDSSKEEGENGSAGTSHTFMEYDLSTSDHQELCYPSQDIREEDIATLKQMLNYACQRATFVDSLKLQSAQEEKDSLLGEINKAQLRCMNDIDTLTSHFLERIQTIHCNLESCNNNVTNTKMNEIQFRGRLAMNQLKRELSGAWEQNRDLMGKIAILSHSKDAILPSIDQADLVSVADEFSDDEQLDQTTASKSRNHEPVIKRHLTVSDNSKIKFTRRARSLDNCEILDEKGHCTQSPSQSDTSKPVRSSSSENIKSTPTKPVRAVLPTRSLHKSIALSANNNESVFPEHLQPEATDTHVICFLQKFIKSTEANYLEKEQVRVLMHALDQAYNDKRLLTERIKEIETNATNKEDRIQSSKSSVENSQIEAQYKKQLSELQNKIDFLLNENRNLSSRLESLQQVVENANKAVEGSKRRILERDQFEADCKVLRDRVKCLEKGINEREKSFQRTLLDLKSELREAMDARQRAEQQICELRSERDSSAVGQVKITKRLQELENERAEAEARASALEENLKIASGKMKKQELQIGEDRSQIAQLQLELRSLSANENSPQYQAVLSKLQVLEEKLRNAENRISEVVCERDQFKFLYELSLQKLKSHEEKSRKFSLVGSSSSKDKKSKQTSGDGSKKSSAFNILEKKLLNKNSTTAHHSAGVFVPQQQPPVPGYNYSPHNAYSSSLQDGSLSSDNRSLNGSSGVMLSNRPKITSPRIPRSPVPPSQEAIHPLSTQGKMKGKWHAL